MKSKTNTISSSRTIDWSRNSNTKIRPSPISIIAAQLLLKEENMSLQTVVSCTKSIVFAFSAPFELLARTVARLDQDQVYQASLLHNCLSFSVR